MSEKLMSPLLATLIILLVIQFFYLIGLGLFLSFYWVLFGNLYGPILAIFLRSLLVIGGTMVFNLLFAAILAAYEKETH